MKSLQPFQSGSNSQAERGLARPLGYDLALLGLSSREARVDAIRDAAQRRAKSIQGSAKLVDEQRQELLSELATSTYRVLDPRKRSKLMERVQLCLISDADYELQQQSHVPFAELGDSSEPFAVAELVEVEANHEAQLRQAKQEIVRFLLKERRQPGSTRLGMVVLSLLVAGVVAPALIAAAILL